MVNIVKNVSHFDVWYRKECDKWCYGHILSNKRKNICSILSFQSTSHADIYSQSMNIDHDWKTRKSSVQLRGMIVCLDKTKKKLSFILKIKNEKEWLMEMTKNNVIHYSKRIIMDCLFRVVFCMLKVSLLMLIFWVWQIEKRWLELFFSFFFVQ